jgi:hypothetical protein
MYPGLHIHRLPLLFGNRNSQIPVNRNSSSVEDDKRIFLNSDAEPKKDTLYFSRKGKKKQKSPEGSPARSYCPKTKKLLEQIDQDVHAEIERKEQKEKGNWRYIVTKKGSQPYLLDPDPTEIYPEQSISQVSYNPSKELHRSETSHQYGSHPLTEHNLRKLDPIKEKERKYQEQLRRDAEARQHEEERKYQEASQRLKREEDGEKEREYQELCDHVKALQREYEDLQKQALLRTKEEEARIARVALQEEKEEDCKYQKLEMGPIRIKYMGPYSYDESGRSRDGRYSSNEHRQYEVVRPSRQSSVAGTRTSKSTVTQRTESVYVNGRLVSQRFYKY